jgi:biotin operon repressor
MDEGKLAVAVQGPTDYSVLVSALASEEALASIRDRDPLAGARLRGIEAKRKLLESEGAPLSSAQAAKLLKISRQAVDKRRRENKLLGLELGKKGYHYPPWQFDLRGLEQILTALGRRDQWEKLSFFLNPSAILGDRTPLTVLRGEKDHLPDIVNAAVSYGEQGG